MSLNDKTQGAGPGGISCGGCIFLDLTDIRSMFCRRYPPQLVVQKGEVKKYFPVVDPFLDWCGEHSPREKSE